MVKLLQETNEGFGIFKINLMVTVKMVKRMKKPIHYGVWKLILAIKSILHGKNMTGTLQNRRVSQKLKSYPHQIHGTIACYRYNGH